MNYIQLFAGAISAAIALAGAAPAAEFYVIPGTKSLLMLGEITDTDLAEFQYATSESDIDTVVLRGPGGSLELAFELGVAP